MAKTPKKRRPPALADLLNPTPNQVVAYNLARARQWRGWTQERAADELAEYLGVRWSKASWSAAERSVDGVRVREFTADEIAAFALAFSLPINWFFLPPADVADSARTGYTAIHVGDSEGLEAYRARVIAEQSGGVRAIADVARVMVDTVVKQAIHQQANEGLATFRDVLARLIKNVDAVAESANEEE